jgi:biotin-(acetyl-CoA carboxylase) ligase
MASTAQPIVRNEDPSTSFAAARRAARASSHAMQVIAEVMSDGRGRTDEEIWQACRTAGLLRSLDVVRHARLALEKNGGVVATGAKRPTENGTASRVWIKAPSPAERDALRGAATRSLPDTGTHR